MSWTTTSSPTYRRYEAGEGIHALIDRYPLLPIREAADHDRTAEVLSDLFGRDDLDDEANGYLDTLIKLVGDYEAREHAIDELMTPAALVHHLMDANGLTVSDIGRIIGSQLAADDFLNGKVAGLSVRRAQRLSQHFRLEIGTFLDSHN